MESLNRYLGFEVELGSHNATLTNALTVFFTGHIEHLLRRDEMMPVR